MLSPDQQQELLDNVVEEFTLRLRQGSRPSIAEFIERYPSLSSEIEELLTSVAMIEELKTQSNTITDSLKREMKQITRLEQIGDYRIVRELGRGGMGVVFEATHESLGRRVAIKVMPNRKFDDQKYLERFRREAQAAANLHHTNIVSVFGLGQTGDHHYYVMEFVDGESLSDILRHLNSMSESNTEDGYSTETMPVSPGNSITSPSDQDFATQPVRKIYSTRERYLWAADVGAQLADGLAYAHALGMLHRDVKPANLLIDKNETVWLTDFGLVKNISNQSITKTGDIIGTPQYMAPESFEGTYDERSETYCLGLTLYEIATLRPAYENATTPELIRKITTSDPAPPKKLEPRIPRDLNRIIEKAVSREPDYRYQTAAELREDLRAFLDDRPISARKISLLENMWRWGRRNPAQAFTSFFVAFMLLTIATAATLALLKNQQLTAEIEQRLHSTDVQVRATKSALNLAEDAIDVTVQFYDRLFKNLVFKDAQEDQEFSLDGFGDLEGVSATIKESDAELLDRMMQFYLNFANNEKNQTNLQLKSLSAFSHRRVANIYHLTGQFEKAVDSYGLAIKIYESVCHSSPSDTQSVLDLIRVCNECGRAHQQKGSFTDRKEAKKQFQKSITLLREQLKRESGDLETVVRMELAKSLLLKGAPTIEYRFGVPDSFKEVKGWIPPTWFAGRNQSPRVQWQPYRILDPQQSLAEVKEALEITDQLALEYVNLQSRRLRDAVLGLGRSNYNFFTWRWKQARTNNAFSKYKALRFLAEVKRAEELRFVSAVGLTRLGTIELANQNYLNSRLSLQKAATLTSELIDSNNANPEYKYLLAQIRSIGHFRAMNSRHLKLRDGRKAAIRSLSQAKEIMVELQNQYANNLDYQFKLGELCFRIALLHADGDQNDKAIENFEVASEIFANLMPVVPRSRQIQASGLYCLMHYVHVLFQEHQYEKAVSIVKTTIEADGDAKFSLRGRIPRNARIFRQAILHRILYIAYTKAQDPPNAFRTWQKAMDLFGQVDRFRRNVNRKRLLRSPD